MLYATYHDLDCNGWVALVCLIPSGHDVLVAVNFILFLYVVSI